MVVTHITSNPRNGKLGTSYEDDDDDEEEKEEEDDDDDDDYDF